MVACICCVVISTTKCTILAKP